jgi:hypothetical protein
VWEGELGRSSKANKLGVHIINLCPPPSVNPQGSLHCLLTISYRGLFLEIKKKSDEFFLKVGVGSEETLLTDQLTLGL